MVVWKSMDELLAYYYGSDFAKSDDPVLTSTPGVYNPIYGAKIWAQLSYEANAFGVLPKYPWNHSGWRVIIDNQEAVGVPEAGAIPDSVKPTFKEIKAEPKEIVSVFENSYRAEDLNDKDDAIMKFAELMSVQTQNFTSSINKQILTDNQTPAGNNLESLDRIVASNTELITKSLAADSLDVYGIDRDAGVSWADAYVDTASSNRALELDMILTAIARVKNVGGNPQVVLTGSDTYVDIINLFINEARYELINNKPVKITINGITTEEGYGVGMHVSTIFGLPLIQSKDVPKDGKSRIYILDTSDPEGLGEPRLGFKTLRPTMYFESKNPFEVGKLSKKGMIYMSGELICKYFKAQAKIRDLA